MNRKDAHTQMMFELEHWQTTLATEWLDQSLPHDWSGLDMYDPVARHKTRVTVRLDSDMVRWFRKLGPGYGARLNAVLRIYWLALLSGQVNGYPNDNVIPRIYNASHEIIDRYRKKT